MKKETLYTLNEDLTYTPKEVEIQEIGDKAVVFILGIICLCWMFFSLVQFEENKTYQKTTTKLQEENRVLKESLIYSSNENLMHLSLENVDDFIEQLPFADKALIKKQYRIESGNLKSELAIKYNNIFGMKTSKRKHTYVGIAHNDYVIYAHWTLSVIDRLLYEIYVGTSLKNYSTDPNYLHKLK